MSWFSDMFGRDQADEVEMGLLVADQTNPYAHLTMSEFRQVMDDRAEMEAPRPVFDCSVCENARTIVCETCGAEPNPFECNSCDGAKSLSCRWCWGTGEWSGGRQCPDCEGSGQAECGECGGEGVVDCSICEGTGEVDCPAECWARDPETGRFFE